MDERLLSHDVIVFDVGNVLVEFDAKRISAGFGLNEALYRGVFESGLWFWEDTGLISNGALADLMCEAAHTESREDYLKVIDLLEHFDRFERPFSGSLLLPELKKAGKKLYYLTNYSASVFERTCARFPYFQYFDGGVVSGREHILKPMPRIFELMCERYGFQPKDAVFVDDNADNIAAAKKLGFAVWQFEGRPIEE